MEFFLLHALTHGNDQRILQYEMRTTITFWPFKHVLDVPPCCEPCVVMTTIMQTARDIILQSQQAAPKIRFLNLLSFTSFTILHCLCNFWPEKGADRPQSDLFCCANKKLLNFLLLFEIVNAPPHSFRCPHVIVRVWTGYDL